MLIIGLLIIKFDDAIFKDLMKKDKEKILDLIEANVFKDGFHKASINYIASTIKMSKKTIYKNFRSKDELLESLIIRFTTNMTNEMELIVKKNISAVEKIVLIIGLLKKIGENFSDRMISEVRIHYPALWQKIEEFRSQVYYKNISKIFTQGIKEKYIIDIPPLIIMTIFQSAIQAVVNPDFIMNNNYSLTNAFKYTHFLLLNGILTDKGRRKLKEIHNKKIKY